MKKISFGERVRTIAIREARRYKEVYIDYEYLILTSKLEGKYYIITGTKENYLHLLGIHSTLKPTTFFDRCILGELKIRDFDFDDEGTDLKGTVRRKIKVLSNMNDLLYRSNVYIQEHFRKNRVICSVGASDNVCTVGFIKTGKRLETKAFPKTLMKGNELDDMREVELLLRREKGKELFDKILIGNKRVVRQHFEDLKSIVSVNLFTESVRTKKYDNRILCLVKCPICFRTDTYSMKLKNMKLRNRRR